MPRPPQCPIEKVISLEDGVVTISRATASLTFPAQIMLVAALNPCPCGYLTDPKRECHCTPRQITAYMGKQFR